MAASKKKIGLVSLGCAKNLVDSENLLACFPKDKFEITLRPDEADVIVVNTCGFIDAAKKEAVETILEMGNYPAKLVVTGCLLYKDLDEIRKSLPEVDLFVPLSDYPRFGELVGKLLEEPVKEIDPLKRELSTALPFAYMKISEGCSNYCAFCAIPYIRGPYRSRTMEELVEEGKILYEKGVRELALVSQDPMHYGVDLPNRPKMVDLLKELTAIGFPSIRLLYLYPDEIDDEFLLYVKDNPAIEKYFDIPIQSGSDEVLKKMNRKDTRESMRKLFARIRELMPKAALRTTLIAGFSGETLENHRETLSMPSAPSFPIPSANAGPRKSWKPSGRSRSASSRSGSARRWTPTSWPGRRGSTPSVPTGTLPTTSTGRFSSIPTSNLSAATGSGSKSIPPLSTTSTRSCSPFFEKKESRRPRGFSYVIPALSGIRFSKSRFQM